jgi:hypothetical protein
MGKNKVATKKTKNNENKKGSHRNGEPATKLDSGAADEAQNENQLKLTINNLKKSKTQRMTYC